MGVPCRFLVKWDTISHRSPRLKQQNACHLVQKMSSKTHASRSGDSVAGFRLRAVLSFSKYERRRSQSFAMPLALVRKIAKAFGVAIANRHKARTESDR